MIQLSSNSRFKNEPLPAMGRNSNSANASREEWHETIIVGGGMAGIGCARRLKEDSKPFLMITPEIGGRVRTSPDGQVNYGAYYVTADYQWTLPMVKTGPKVRITDGWFHRDGERYRFLSTRLLKHLPALIRFMSDLREFRTEFNRMNELAVDFSRAELIAASPLLHRTYSQMGSDYIVDRKLEGLFQDFIDPLMWASFFHDPYQVSTFFLLAASLPLIVPMYSFVMDMDKATAGFRDQIRYDSVTLIDPSLESPRVVTAQGKVLRCDNLVLATPMNHTNRLLRTLAQPTRKGIDVSFYHVQGTLRKPYRGSTRNFVGSQDGAVVSREADGTYLYFYASDQIDKYFEEYKIITHDTWKPALFFLGKELINSHPTSNLFIASDHDVPSIENAYINGRYTANLLIRQAAAKRVCSNS